MIKGTAPMRLELEFDGSDEELIQIAERIASPDSLDSRDLGDSMGVFITHAMFNDSEFSAICNCGKHTLMVWIHYDLFKWEGIQK